MSSLQSSIDTHTQSAFNVSALRVQQHALMKRMFMDCRKTYNIALQYVVKNGWHRQEYLLSTHFNKNEMKSLLQKMFVSVENIGKHKAQSALRVMAYFVTNAKSPSTTGT